MLRHEVIACELCPRLVAYRREVAQKKKPQFQEWDYWGRPVPGWGDPNARIVIIGLAPAAHGGNRTGRLFTGDATARFLMAALYETGFANLPTSEHRDDGLQLQGVYLTAAVKCAPPSDRPSRDEIERCTSLFLRRELAILRSARVVLTLGQIAFQAFLQHASAVLNTPLRLPFQHGARYVLSPQLPVLFVSYHTSPRNTQTGRLSREAFVELLKQVGEEAKSDIASDEHQHPQ